MLKDMAIRMCRSFTVFNINLIVPISLIGSKRLNGRKIMEELNKDSKQEVYTSSCKIIKKKIPNNNHKKFLKAGTEGMDNLVSATLSFLFKNDL